MSTTIRDILSSAVENFATARQLAQLSLKNPRDVLHHDKWKKNLNSHVTIPRLFVGDM